MKTFNKHRPVDRADPGFTLPGYQLRWISGRIAETNPGRIWMILRKAEMPTDLVKHIESHHPGAFSHGDTVRRGDLVLAYATKEVHKDLKAEKLAATRELENTIKRVPRMADNQMAKVTHYESVDSTKEMVDRFRKAKED